MELNFKKLFTINLKIILKTKWLIILNNNKNKNIITQKNFQIKITLSHYKKLNLNQKIPGEIIIKINKKN